MFGRFKKRKNKEPSKETEQKPSQWSPTGSISSSFQFSQRSESDWFHEHLTHFQDSPRYHLSVMYSHITSEDPEIVKEASGIIADYLRTLDIRALLRLSDDFRQTTSLMWSIDWSRTDITKIEQTVGNKETFLWLMRLGTFHPNGYFRERCTWRLRSDPPSYMYILLRLNDWVDQVCDCAKEALNDFSQMTLDDLMMCLFAMEKLRRCERLNIFTYREIKEKLAKRLRELTPVIEKAQMLRYDDMTRRACYRLLLEQQCLSADEIRGILSWEPHPQCQILLISMYLSYGDISEEELDEFLTHKSLIVRRFALERKHDLTGKPWAGMEDMLLSPSASIRSDVRYILRKHTDMDFRSYYLEHLGRQDARITVKKICILGLAETGKPEDADLLRDYLSENNAGITKNTLHALGSLRASDFHEVFWKYLQDERTPIMVQAYREIASHNIRYGGKKIYDLFIETSSEHLRKKLAYLLNAENYWDRIPYILMLYNYENEDVRHILRRGTRSPSSSFGATKERLDLIAGILADEKYDLPEQLKKSVRFNLKVAGI